MKHWYAVHCKPGQDARAEEHLGYQEYEVLRPLARVRKRYRGQIKHTIESLFPRYLFIHLDDVLDNWAPIRSTRGVVTLLKFTDQPAIVPDLIIDRLNDHMDAEHCLDLTNTRYQPNQQVRIVDGPFKGHEALFHARRGEDRVIILFSFMHQTQHLIVPEDSIEVA